MSNRRRMRPSLVWHMRADAIFRYIRPDDGDARRGPIENTRIGAVILKAREK